MQKPDISQYSAVNLDTCHSLKNTKKPFIFVVNEGDNLFASIQKCADTINLPAASITGLGALTNITISSLSNSKPHPLKVFSGTFEIVSLIGNVTFANGQRFVHIHAAIGDAECNVFGGHVVEAFAGASTEISFFPLSSAIHRKFSAKHGIQLICPIQN